MVNISSSQKETQSAGIDLLSALNSSKSKTGTKTVSSKKSFSEIVKEKTKEKTHKAHSQKAKETDDRSNDTDQISDTISAIMELLEKAKTTNSDSDTNNETASDSDTQNSNTPLTFQSQLSSIQNNLLPNEKNGPQSSQEGIQNAVNSISGLSDSDKKALTDKLVSLMSALKSTDKNNLSAKDTKSLDSLMELVDTKSGSSDSKSSDNSSLMDQIKLIITNGNNKPKDTNTNIQQSEVKQALVDGVRGLSRNNNLEASMLDSLKDTTNNTSQISNTTENFAGQSSQSVSQIASVVESTLSTVSISNSSDSSPSSAKESDHIPVNIDSLFNMVVDKSDNSSGQQEQNQQNSESSLLSTTSISAIKDTSSESSGEFDNILGQITSTQREISSDSKETKSENEAQKAKSTQSTEDTPVDNFSNIVQSRNLSMTVKTGDNVPVRVRIKKSDDGTSVLSLQSSDDHVTSSLHKTQDTLSHKLIESGLKDGSFKIDILPTDSQSSSQDQLSQNMNQQSFSGDNGGSSQQRMEQYELNIGKQVSDDIILQQNSNNTSEMSYNGLHQSLNISV